MQRQRDDRPDVVNADVEDASGDLLLGTDRIHDHRSTQEIESAERLVRRGILVDPVRHLDLHENQAVSTFDRRHQDPPFIFGLTGGAENILAVESDRGRVGVTSPGSRAQGVVEGVGRHRGQDVLEGGRARRVQARLREISEPLPCNSVRRGRYGYRGKATSSSGAPPTWFR